jgi:hypothetical protein
MSVEAWAQRIVEKELKQTVVVHDDNSAPRMYDLRIGAIDAPDVAIECVRAADSTFAETWNAGPAKGPFQLSISGDWNIAITTNARVKVIKQNVEPLLQNLEGKGIENMYVDHRLKWQDAVLFEEFESLGITHAFRYREQGAGRVDLLMPGIGGAVDVRGDSVPEWVKEFLKDSARQDVLLKLQQSGATECHVFLIVTFAGAPWSVESYLTGELEQLPNQTPELPSPVAGVWIVSEIGRKGLRWNGNTWQIFTAQGEGIDY